MGLCQNNSNNEICNILSGTRKPQKKTHPNTKYHTKDILNRKKFHSLQLKAWYKFNSNWRLDFAQSQLKSQMCTILFTILDPNLNYCNIVTIRI